MKRLLGLIAVFMSLNAAAQSNFNTYKDAQNGSVVFDGQFTFEDLMAEKTFGWMKKGMDMYKPDTISMKYLKQNINQYRLVILMGTWCDDSQIMIPRLYKVLSNAGFNMENYSMFGVNRAKQTMNLENKFYNLVNVPTIILYRNNFEKGRIIETVKLSVEADLARLIKADLEQKN